MLSVLIVYTVNTGKDTHHWSRNPLFILITYRIAYEVANPSYFACGMSTESQL